MRALDFVPVDRVERRKAVAMFGASLELVRRGRSPLVFPEETYGSPDGMLPFQRGGFLLASRSGLPVLPLGISGTEQAFPPDAFVVRPTTVVVRFGEPIAVDSLGVSERDLLERRTRAAIERLCRPDLSGREG
jgi:1-acyl-sn-glycerol-3-phosphate acyltransferase